MAVHAPILAAEDDENDALFLTRAHKEAGLENPLVIVRDGQEAVDYLGGASIYADRAAHPLPGLLLLDLKMPRMNGFDVLAWLAMQPDLKHLPVIILSSSSNEADMERARQMGARDYLIKPHHYRELTGMLRDLSARWLVEVPQTT